MQRFYTIEFSVFLVIILELNSNNEYYLSYTFDAINLKHH